MVTRAGKLGRWIGFIAHGPVEDAPDIEFEPRWNLARDRIIKLESDLSAANAARDNAHQVALDVSETPMKAELLNGELESKLKAANDEVKALKELPQSLRDSTLSLAQGRWLNKHGDELNALRKVKLAADDVAEFWQDSGEDIPGARALVKALDALDAGRGKDGAG